MDEVTQEVLRTQLLDRRQKLETAIADSQQAEPFVNLLQEVDSALDRMEKGSYGICETCNEAIETERLHADPLLRYCLPHLTPAQQRALEDDLELAARIQGGLLPKQDLHFPGWEIYYHYDPAGPVSGDYCDLIHSENSKGELFFLLGDVSGKGVSASMLMTHLHAMFRSLITVGLPLDQLVALANRVFCESALSGHYATLVCGRANRAGDVEVSIAGHCPPLLVRRGEVTPLESTGLPLGMFHGSQYTAHRIQLVAGDSLLLYTDGLSEARDASNSEYGLGQLSEFVAQQHGLPPQALIAACLQDLKAFSAGAPKSDDLTIMVLRRTA